MGATILDEEADQPGQPFVASGVIDLPPCPTCGDKIRLHEPGEVERKSIGRQPYALADLTGRDVRGAGRDQEAQDRKSGVVASASKAATGLNVAFFIYI